MAKLCHQVGIAGDTGKVYDALHLPSGLIGWWATTADGTPAVGNSLNLHFADLATLSFRIEDLAQNERVQLQCVAGPGTWLDSTLTFSLNSADDQVWVHLDHENKTARDADFLYFSTKWPCYLLSLKALIETGTGRPYPNDIKIHVGD